MQKKTEFKQNKDLIAAMKDNSRFRNNTGKTWREWHMKLLTADSHLEHGYILWKTTSKMVAILYS